jgi:hypothetical protein
VGRVDIFKIFILNLLVPMDTLKIIHTDELIHFHLPDEEVVMLMELLELMMLHARTDRTKQRALRILKSLHKCGEINVYLFELQPLKDKVYEEERTNH